MTFTDRNLTCKDCGTTFLFSAREQEFYAAKGFENDPARCPECREVLLPNLLDRSRASASPGEELFVMIEHEDVRHQPGVPAVPVVAAPFSKRRV